MASIWRLRNSPLIVPWDIQTWPLTLMLSGNFTLNFYCFSGFGRTDIHSWVSSSMLPKPEVFICQKDACYWEFICCFYRELSLWLRLWTAVLKLTNGYVKNKILHDEESSSWRHTKKTIELKLNDQINYSLVKDIIHSFNKARNGLPWLLKMSKLNSESW